MQITPVSDPFALFSAWFAEAAANETGLPHAMSVATVGAAGMPSLRMVLLKGVDQRGFVYYTNTQSRKAAEVGENAHAALCFHWKSIRRQVRVEGGVDFVTDAEADEYWASRPRETQIGAWASKAVPNPTPIVANLTTRSPNTKRDFWVNRYHGRRFGGAIA